MESGAVGKAGLVLAGGGARAAYQVGVLKAIREMLPDPTVNPFPIICGTSAGAVNAGALAVRADDFGLAVENLVDVWRNFQPHHVYRADWYGATRNNLRWMAGFLFGAFMKRRRSSLLDNRPLEGLLAKYLDFSRIEQNISKGALDAVAITCSGYTSGHSCSFFQGAEGMEGWKRSTRIGIRTQLTVQHLMASSAIPFVFPPYHVNREFFGDGSMRQIAPVSPALRLGADRVVVVGTARIRHDAPERLRGDNFPTLAQIAGHVMNSIFLDSHSVDIERLERINRTVSCVSPDGVTQMCLTLHHVAGLVHYLADPLASS